ncbi:alpha/beta hydrolase [Candidatus Parcubacteria bacterium]|nr:alpha/beta hydrolase [Candidatus Parcubacteria bacterium]
MNSVNPQKISEKQIQINGLNVNYKTIGNGKIPIVLLHGWGVSSDKYLELICWLHSPAGLWSPSASHRKSQSENARRLHSPAGTMEPTINSKFKILVPDLPGFGKSDEPKENWDLDDYVEFVDEFIKKTSRKGGFELVKNILAKMQETQIQRRTNICSPSDLCLIGHSFGGGIAIKYATKYPEKIDKLILTGARGIKRKLTAKQRVLFIIAKTGKLFFSLPIINNFQKLVYKLFSKIAWKRKKDYYNATPRMKEIMKNVLAENLMDCLDKIKNPTLLVWGREDKTTPLADGEIMNEKIKNSELVVVDDANHRLPYQKPKEFAEIINRTLTNTD